MTISDCHVTIQASQSERLELGDVMLTKDNTNITIKVYTTLLFKQLAGELGYCQQKISSLEA